MNETSSLSQVMRRLDAAMDPAPERTAVPAGGKMGEQLVSAGLLTPAQVDQAIALQQRDGLRFGEAAVRLGFLTERDIQGVLSEQFNYANALMAHPGIDATLAIAHDPFSREAEAIRQIRAEISLRLNGRTQVSLAVVSPNDREGKSYLAASLAIAYSQSGQRVLLIDANLRASASKSLFSLGAAPGLSSMLAGRAAGVAGRAVPGFPLLHVLDAGPPPPNPTEILGNPALRRFITEVGAEFDMVIVDTPAANRSADAQIIASQTDACLLLARQDRTLLQDYLQTQERIRRAGAQMIGAVYNGHEDGQQDAKPAKWWQSWRRSS